MAMPSGTWKLVLVMTAAVATLAIGETLIAKGMRQTGQDVGAFAWIRAAVGNGWVVSGAVLLALHLVLYATALAGADLSLVMPITAASYPLGALLARFFLHEEVNLARWLGTAIIAAGVAVVAWGEGRSSP
jgi:drug/metabolite transporter (DMT)-like permease